jgi:hypothetical protein
VVCFSGGVYNSRVEHCLVSARPWFPYPVPQKLKKKEKRKRNVIYFPNNKLRYLECPN